MIEFTVILSVASVILDVCPTPETVGSPWSTVTQSTTTEEIDWAGGPTTVPSKLWHNYYDNSAAEFFGTVANYAVTIDSLHDPACPHGLAWGYPLEGANYNESHDYAVYSAACSVGAHYAYKLTRSITTTAGAKFFPILGTNKVIYRVGNHFDEVNLFPYVYYVEEENPGGPGGGS